MLIQNITLRGNNTGSKMDIPFVDMIGIQLNFISVVKNLLEGSDSNEWLLKAHENINKKLFNGRHPG